MIQIAIAVSILMSLVAGFIGSFLIHLIRLSKKLDEDYAKNLNEKKKQQRIFESLKGDYSRYEQAATEIRIRELHIQLRMSGLSTAEIEKRLRESFFKPSP